MKEYKIVYQLKSGEVYYVYCNKGVRQEIKSIKELHQIQNNPVVAIDYMRIG